MLTSEWWDGPLPERPDFGALYPRRAVQLHALTRGFGRRLEQALRVLEEARAVPVDWHVCLSGGKDSTAVGLLMRRLGWSTSALSARDDLCWPGEDLYLTTLAERCGLDLRRVVVPLDLQVLARGIPGSLTSDHEAKSGALSKHWYRALNLDEKAAQVGGKVWGIRADENDHRRRNRVTHGRLYQRKDGLWICAPLSDWSAMDVHALVAAEGVPLHPVYSCVDPGVDPMMMRHSWWVYGGRGLERHYVWLRRWWPHLWDLATEIDPRVADLG